MKRIRKVSQSTPIKAKVVNSYSESEEETYSCDYINNAKANSSDVYTKAQLDGNLLPMTRIAGSTLGDSSTITLPIEKNRPYIFINTHVYNREIILITIYNSNISVDRIINTGATDLTSFTLNGDKLTIKGATRCRGHLYRLNYQITA